MVGHHQRHSKIVPHDMGRDIKEKSAIAWERRLFRRV